MAEETRLQEVIEQLNALLGDVTPYKLAIVAPGDIRPVDKNAHYMPKRVFDQLQSNVAKDGNLSSLPFCWRGEDGSFVSMSGNHRVKVAGAAGVERIMVLYTDDALSQAEQIAIQLSHNALVGQENPTTLRELWNEIDDLKLKVYSGLDDELLEAVDPVAITQIKEAALRFEELRVLFLSSEIDHLEETVKRVGKATRRRFGARVDDFDQFFEVLLKFKDAAGIVNTGTAFLAMIEIVEGWVAEHNESEQDEPKE